MEVMSAYKQTEVGLIPDDWMVRPLSAVADIRGGIAKNANTTISDPISVHYLRVANVQDGFLSLGEMSRIELSRGDLLRYKVQPGDVLMNEGGDLDKLGRGAIWRGEFDPCVHQNHVFVVRCKADLLPEYLNIWTATSPVRRFFLVAGKQTTNLASISKSSLGELPVAFPSLSEQRAIAETLSDVDALLAGLDRLIAKKRDLKQAAMQQLLTGQTRLPGFQGEWEVKRLGDHVSFLKNGVHSRAELTANGSIKNLHYGDIHASGGVTLDPSSMPSLSSDRAHTLGRLTNGDLVFVDASEDLDGVGKSVEIVGAAGVQFVAGLHTIATRFESAVLADGFKAYLQSCPPFRQHLRRLAAGTKVYATNRAHISSVEMRLPTVQEQAAIATVLSDMDAELTALEARCDKTHALKKAMMQELLTGRTRLV